MNVESDSLRQSSRFQLEQAARAAEIADQVRTAATVGNAFGKIGQIAGLEASYLQWVEGESVALAELTRMLSDLAEGLADAAAAHDGTDQAGADRLYGTYGGRS